MKNVTAKTKSGIIFRGNLSEPDIKNAIIIHIHGMSGSYTDSNFYEPMHSGYPAQRIAFLVGEHRGTGSITEFETTRGKIKIGSALEKFEDCVEDIQAWVDFALSLGYSKIWLHGHSLGAPKVVYYMHRVQPNRVTGLVLLSPSEMVGLVHDPVGQIDYDVMFPEAVKLVNEGKPSAILSRKLWEVNTMSAGTFLNLFASGTNSAIFNYADSSLGWQVVNNILVPVVAITGTKDDGIATVIDANKAMEKLKLELVKSPKVKTIVYENAEHNFEGFEKKIVRDVVNFIQAR